MDTLTYTDHTNLEITYYKWAAGGTPKAVVQMVHGMGEHALRYDHVAQTLNAAGYLVYAEDHRGHGKTSEVTGVGLLGSDGWQGTVENLKELHDIIKKENPALPVFLLGHSWGSFMSQNFIQNWGSELKGVILSGTGGKQATLGVLIMLAKRINKKSGPAGITPLMQKLSVEPLNKPFQPSKTSHDWLSRDEAVVQTFLDDPLCGAPMPNGYWLEFALGLKHIWTKANEAKIPKDLPIFMITGELDPVNVQTKTFMILVKRYQKLGIKDLTYKIYDGARHEVLNELQKDDVKQDIVNFLDSHL